MDWAKLDTIFSGTNTLILLGLSVKVWFAIKEHRLHTHTEKGQEEVLTTNGIIYSRTMNGGSE